MTAPDTTVPTADAQADAAPSTNEAAEATGAEKPNAKRTPKPKKAPLTFVVVPATGQVRAYRGVPKVDFKQGEIGIWEAGHLSRLKPETIVKLYNTVRPEKPLTRLTNRAAVEKQLYPAALELLAGTPLAGGGKVTKDSQEQDSPISTTTEDTAMPAAKKGAKKAASKKVAVKKTTTKSSANGRRGRASQFSGKTITKAKDSTRTAGSLGHASWVLIEKAKNGITYEDFLAKGGRRKDLAWEQRAGTVKIK